MFGRDKDGNPPPNRKRRKSPTTRKNLRKLLTNPSWRLQNLYAIRPKEGGISEFHLNNAQRFVSQQYWWVNYVLKSRQQGISTWWVIFFLDQLLFNPNKVAGVIDITDKDARKKLAMAKIAYENLDNQDVHPEFYKVGAIVKEQVRMTKGTDAEFPEELVFSNGSQFWAGVGFRGSTLQYGLFTEFGKISHKNPQKAKEIVEGAENGMHKGSIAVYETTHEGGRSGIAYERCQLARRGEQDREKMSRLDQRFLFIPWFVDSDNDLGEGAGRRLFDRLKEDPMIDTSDGPWNARKYFQELDDSLRAKKDKEGYELSWGQKAWYVSKRRSQGHGMLKEHPSTPDEPFEAPIKGAIYAPLIVTAREQGRIGHYPYDKNVPVWTFWDLGAPDNTVVWYVQKLDGCYRCLRCDVGTKHLHGEETGDRVARVNSLGYSYAGHILPHDGAHTQKGGITFKKELERAGLGGIHMLARIGNVITRINRLKGMIPMMEFDREGCEDGLLALEHYHWKEDPQVPDTYTDKPCEGWSSHPSDALGYLAEAEMRKVLGHAIAGADSAADEFAAMESGDDTDIGLRSWGQGSAKDRFLRQWG